MFAQASIFIHIIAGILTLITGPVAILSNYRNTPLHRIAGKTFFIAMNIVCISAIIGFLKRPQDMFYQFLLGISIIVWAGILRGVRALQIRKTGEIKRIDYIYTGILALFSIWMLVMSLKGFAQNTDIAFPILFGVFGFGAISDVYTNIKMFSNPMKYENWEWLNLHVGSMLGCFIASTTAFTVNTAHYLPWYIQWFGPTVVLVPVIIYWQRKLKPDSKKRELAHR